MEYTPKFAKAGPKKKKVLKTKRFLNHNIEPPENRACINCKILTETENYHHAESSRIKFLSGGGIVGGKIKDRLSAWLCNKKECGIKFDTKPNRESTQHEKDQHDLFSYDCIAKTHNLGE